MGKENKAVTKKENTQRLGVKIHGKIQDTKMYLDRVAECMVVKNTDNMEVKGKGLAGILQHIGLFFNRHAAVISCVFMIAIMTYGMVHADTQDELWNKIAELIKTWVVRLGGVIMFVGGIMFGLGWKSDDAEQKSRGIQTIIAGAIVIAVAGLTSSFFSSGGSGDSGDGGKTKP